ncbi:MAG TPA: ferritin family protein, partial [Flexilinea sp.]|nr:ferritin family protein [Flexilinea sp.]
MSNLFNGAEFFEMMAANEKAVGDLYRFLAKDAKFGGKFFENMAADEDRHYGIYTSLLKKYQGKKDLMVELAEDRKSYMDLLIKNNYLSDPEKLKERAANAKSKEDIFDIAE